MTITSNFIGIGTPPIQATMLEDTFKVTIKEADGTPIVENVKTIVVSNGTLTDDGNGQVTLTTGGSAGTITLSGDVTGSGTTSITATIANDAVTYAKIQNVAANSVLARAASSSGDVSAVALSASQLLGRGASGDVAAITLGSGLSMSGTTVSASGGFTSFTSYTPTFTISVGSINSSTIHSAAYAFSGDLMCIRFGFTLDCTAGALATMSLPSGITGATVSDLQIGPYIQALKSSVQYLIAPYISSNGSTIEFYAVPASFDYTGVVRIDGVLMFEVQGAP